MSWCSQHWYTSGANFQESRFLNFEFSTLILKTAEQREKSWQLCVYHYQKLLCNLTVTMLPKFSCSYQISLDDFSELENQMSSSLRFTSWNNGGVTSKIGFREENPLVQVIIWLVDINYPVLHPYAQKYTKILAIRKLPNPRCLIHTILSSFQDSVAFWGYSNQKLDSKYL